MDKFIARQPIFNKIGRVVGYELLFRSGLENVFRVPPGGVRRATQQTIADSMLTIGLDTLTGGKPAYFNLNRDALLGGYALLLPKKLAVIEILETVEPDEQVLEACRELQQAGYRLALDDFSYDARYDPLIELVKIIKIDFLATTRAEREELVRRFRPKNIQLLAEKVETHEAFEEARAMGFTLFQGFFFGKPKIVSSKELPANKLHYMQILFEIHQPDFGFDKLEQILKRETSLTLKLLKYINSVYFAWRSKVDSIHRALVMLGEREIRKWATIVMLSSLCWDKPEELIVHSVVRGRFCEQLAPAFGMPDKSQSLFLVGLFSLINAMLDRPLEEILRDVPLADEIKQALLGTHNPLREVHEYTLAYERADWETVAGKTYALGQDEAAISTLYREALEWAARSVAREAQESAAS